MSLHFEFKTFRPPGDVSVQIDPARAPEHTRDNLTVTPSGSWATAAAATSGAGVPEMIVVTNAGAAAVRVAQSADADPTRFHIVTAGTQRAFEYRPSLPIKVRTL